MSYTDVTGNRRKASRPTLLALLRALGAPLDGPDDIPAALRARRLEQWRRPLDPITVAWEGRMPAVGLRMPARLAARRLRCRIELEGGGETVSWTLERNSAQAERIDIEGVAFVERPIVSNVPLPPGYHRLVVEGAAEAETLLVSAPRRVRSPGRERSWGVFLPLYALRSERSWGIGDFTDLEALLRWVNGLGGEAVATLPLFAAFSAGPMQPSPYSPASRLFWDEVYVDVERVPELARCAEARAVLESAAFRGRLDALRSKRLTDTSGVAAAKRGVLEMLARSMFSERPGRLADLRAFVREQPAVEDYARFRAAGERHGRPWAAWPASERDGSIPRLRAYEDSRRYHLYVQWLAAGQLAEVGRKARSSGAGLYLDLPLGVNPDGYDVWRERSAFLFGASAGAPPDGYFREGQNWGFPPLHPEAVRQQHYRYPIACLRHLLSHASVLRIDHVMGLHRLYCVPAGFDPRQGAYVSYRPDEFYAILALESRRGDALIVGEDLGTVPSFVRQALSRHGVHRSYVLQEELRDGRDGRSPLPPVPADSVASLNTHDMAPFASFFWEKDIERRAALSWIDGPELREELARRRRLRRALVRYLRSSGRLPRAKRERDGVALHRRILRGSLFHLAESRARMVVVNLEDLLMETRPQNLPGTTSEYPNWRRPARRRLEQVQAMPGVVDTLRRVDRLRKGSAP